MTEVEGEPLAGTSYRIVRRIGAGSASEVFEVRGRRGEVRALKLLHAMHAGSREVAARLVQEGSVLGALDHPGLVRVEEVGVTADGRPFLVMPLLRGETLRERLEACGPLSPPAAAAVAIGLLDALGAAHRAGVIHRDVKPANVFLEAARPKLLGARPAAERALAERVVLLDFGIAKVLGAAGDPSTGGHVIGTPRYLAPEQILGGRVDARTDVYAVGLLLFEAIAGRTPFQAGDALAFMRAHVRVSPMRLGAVRPVDPELERVVDRALAKVPAQRWQSAREMAEALSAACPPRRDARRAAAEAR